ncbi:MAG: short-subunit dehydrogenase [Halioglobus sp.]|jgi:short-subunit dehydrogenase
MTERRTALITGASAGLGAEFARQLAAAGYNLVLVARRIGKLEDVASKLRAEHGVECSTIAADLVDPAAPQDIYDTVGSRGITIDYLVNNAGIAGPNLLEDRDWQEQSDFYQLMMVSVAHLCHLFIPGMQERNFGRVINVASVAARLPRPDGCNYGSSKAYLVALSEALAVTLKGTDVKVSALCPGFTHTDFHETAGLQDMKASMPKWLWYPAAVVVADGIKAVEKGKPVRISGRLYRWLDPFFQSVWTRRLFRAPGRD